MNVSKKQKVVEERRILKNDVIYKYFLTEVEKNAHADIGRTLSTRERPTRAKELDRKLVKQQEIFRKDKIPQIEATRACFMVAYNIAKHSNSLCDGEFVKIFVLDVVGQVCPEHRKKFEEIS
ncbi:hypothetical protein RF11_08544 [Thelohanellus kitauei]|uniref:Uncharacterized protein n=1 Tax=Thelohanellus kitauei TaxID=669202 RepID=A0A0C2N138_THEKT|nr:hypothetical protein RF11_08544 [Thelohanellus kitauei]